MTRLAGQRPTAEMGNVLSDEKKQQVLALGRLGWPLRRIEEATGVRRETSSRYLRAAGVAVRPPRQWGHAKAAKEVITDPGQDADSNPAKEPIPDLGGTAWRPPGRSPPSARGGEFSATPRATVHAERLRSYAAISRRLSDTRRSSRDADADHSGTSRELAAEGLLHCVEDLPNSVGRVRGLPCAGDGVLRKLGLTPRSPYPLLKHQESIHDPGEFGV